MNDMTMAFFREDPNTSFDMPDFTVPQGSSAPSAAPRSIPLIRSKLRAPEVAGTLPRKWLTGVLEKSARNSAATIIVGRAGTGKTTLAGEFASNSPDASWYTIDAADGDWCTFRSYFRAAVLQEDPRAERTAKLTVPNCETPLELFADVTASLELRSKPWPSLLVLDGIHHLFDRPWFHQFFEYLVASTPADSHTLLLSRSKPPTPVWRMRSKQVLNVIDEKLLAFSAAEARDLFEHIGTAGVDVETAVKESFGHAGALAETAGLRGGAKAA